MEEEKNKLICFVCKKSDVKITLFSEETLKKCHAILKLRKIHNLKYKDIILPDEYTDGGYHRECHKTFTGLMKKYYTSEPVLSKKKSAKEQLTSVVTENLSPVTPLTPELTTNLQTTFPTASEQNLFFQSTEPQPSISQEQSQLPPVLAEPSASSEPTLISESGASQPATIPENPDVSGPDDSEHNNAPEDVNIPTENDASINNSQIVCIFCNKKKKKVRSIMLTLHVADTNRFKSSILPNIEGLKEYNELLITLNNFSEQENVFNIIQRFICDIYHVRNIIDVDAARLQMFIDSYTVSDVNEAFNRKKLRNFDASSLPPCKSELLQQFLRANYICTIWNNAHLKIPTSYGPENNGWVLENDQYHFKWFEGDQLPNYVSNSLATLTENNEEGDIEDDQSTDRSSSDEDDEDIDDTDENN